MNYFATVGYHDGDFEVEVIVSQALPTKEEADIFGDKKELEEAYLYEDRLIIGKSEHSKIIKREDEHLYQFKVCRVREQRRQENKVVTEEDYESITWDEALEYIKDHYQNNKLPFSLEAYYHGGYENQVTFT